MTWNYKDEQHLSCLILFINELVTFLHMRDVLPQSVQHEGLLPLYLLRHRHSYKCPVIVVVAALQALFIQRAECYTFTRHGSLLV